MTQPATISGFGPPPSIAPADPHGVRQPKPGEGEAASDPEIAQLTDEIVKLLRSPSVQAVNFKWRHMRIDPEGWNMVAAGVADGRIKLVIDRGSVGGIGINTIAYYNWKENQLTFRNARVIDSPNKRAVIVHECAHAVHDAHRHPVKDKDAHAMVYLAEAWHRLNVAGAKPGGGVPFMKHGIPSGFYQIAQELRARAATTPGPVEMTDDEIALTLKKFRNKERSDRVTDNDGF